MIACIHQPQYFPWLGFFHKVAKADVYVCLDDAQYMNRSFMNRNKIRTPEGFQWLTVPVKSNLKCKINEVKINNNLDWKKTHLESIKRNYGKSDYFENYFSFFEDFYSKELNSLIELNLVGLKFVLKELGINKKIVLSSSLNISSKSTQRLVDLCKAVNADTYLSGLGGEQYMDESLFGKHGLNLEYQKFTHPKYVQRFKGLFIEDLSILDLLFNEGPDSLKIILGEKK